MSAHKLGSVARKNKPTIESYLNNFIKSKELDDRYFAEVRESDTGFYTNILNSSFRICFFYPYNIG